MVFQVIRVRRAKNKPGRQLIASDPVSVNKPTPLQGQGA